MAALAQPFRFLHAVLTPPLSNGDGLLPLHYGLPGRMHAQGLVNIRGCTLNDLVLCCAAHLLLLRNGPDGYHII